jgi:hypothetical protein
MEIGRVFLPNATRGYAREIPSQLLPSTLLLVPLAHKMTSMMPQITITVRNLQYDGCVRD